MTIRRFLRRGIGSWLSLPVLTAFAVAVSVHNPVLHRASFDNLKSIPSAEFSRLVNDMSEEGGYFFSDNFTSNETSYLHVVDKLREMSVTGGAYIGVGPEQNFTYIAKLRPQIAFIIDIRRQAMLQHLLYKALFHISESRAEFLSVLLSRPISGDKAPGKGDSIERLMEYFSSASAPEKTYTANLTKVLKIIREEFKFKLSDRDEEQVNYIYAAFHKEGLDISYVTGGMDRRAGPWRFPNLRDLILQPDLNGKLGSFLATEEDYRFVRSLHSRNRIIPVVGDFAGTKALVSIGEYLKKNGYTVRAFYTSNVEQYLFRNGVFRGFVDNVRRLPTNSESVFIRAVPSTNQSHPAQVAGHRLTTLLQKIPVFLKDFDDGAYTNYWTLVTTHFITGQ